MWTASRNFLERKVEGPSVLRLWPGLYFNSDADTESGSGKSKGGKRKKKILKGEGMAAKLQVFVHWKKTHDLLWSCSCYLSLTSCRCCCIARDLSCYLCYMVPTNAMEVYQARSSISLRFIPFRHLLFFRVGSVSGKSSRVGVRSLCELAMDGLCVSFCCLFLGCLASVGAA